MNSEDSQSIGSGYFHSEEDDNVSIDMEEIIDSCKEQCTELMKQWLQKNGELLFKKLAIETLMKLEKRDLELHTTREIKRENITPKTAESSSTNIPESGSKKKVKTLGLSRK